VDGRPAAGRSTFYKYGAPSLARHGYALFSVDYRLGKAGTYPGSAYDLKAAIQVVRAKAVDLGLDPERIGLMGDSAGAHLAALVALALDQFTAKYPGDPNNTASSTERRSLDSTVYDMAARWQHDQIARPTNSIAEKYLGTSLIQDRRLYFDSSPMSYATTDRNRVRFLLVNGTADDQVDPTSRKPSRTPSTRRASSCADS
jgi:acetyl esterase/lipase